ncbi:hypothetical protein PIB30_061899, partial [Stylosanthes scabra]|nr:hypothetical protein [Stylosanthes scabra]
MGERFVVPVFHHEGELVRYPNGELVYANRSVERFDDVELDIDRLNVRDLVTLLEDVGYRSHKAMHWLDTEAPELETGLNELVGDQGIRDLRVNVDTINLDDSNSGGDEAFEDDLSDTQGGDGSSDMEVMLSQPKGKRMAKTSKKTTPSNNKEILKEGKGKGKLEE